MGLDSVELLMAVEEEFGIDIPNAEAEGIITAEDLLQVILRHSFPRLGVNEDEVWERLRRVIIDDTATEPAKVVRSARIIQDFGLS